MSKLISILQAGLILRTVKKYGVRRVAHAAALGTLVLGHDVHGAIPERSPLRQLGDDLLTDPLKEVAILNAELVKANN